jgi:hypothetical protein
MFWLVDLFTPVKYERINVSAWSPKEPVQSSLSLPGSNGVHGKGNAFEDAIADHILVNEALKLASQYGTADFEQLGDYDEPIARMYHTTKPDLLQPAEAYRLRIHELVFLSEIAGQLGGRLAHDHARHDRHFRHVATDPEVVGADVLVSHAGLTLGIVEDYRRELFHLEPLPIVAADLFDIGHHVVQINFGRIKNQRPIGHAKLLGRLEGLFHGSCRERGNLACR